jgi:hypothetical protein
MTYAIIYLFVAAACAFAAGFCRMGGGEVATVIAFWPLALLIILIVAPMVVAAKAGILIYHAGLALSERFA